MEEDYGFAFTEGVVGYAVAIDQDLLLCEGLHCTNAPGRWIGEFAA